MSGDAIPVISGVPQGSVLVKKCKYMVLSRKWLSVAPPALLLNGLPLENRSIEFKYLHLLKPDLDVAYCDKICSKTKKLVGIYGSSMFP